MADVSQIMARLQSDLDCHDAGGLTHAANDTGNTMVVLAPDLRALLDEVTRLREDRDDSEERCGRFADENQNLYDKFRAAEEKLAEIARLRLATNEGSLRVRADRIWEIATGRQERLHVER